MYESPRNVGYNDIWLLSIQIFFVYILVIQEIYINNIHSLYNYFFEFEVGFRTIVLIYYQFMTKYSFTNISYSNPPLLSLYFTQIL